MSAWGSFMFDRWGWTEVAYDVGASALLRTTLLIGIEAGAIVQTTVALDLGADAWVLDPYRQVRNIRNVSARLVGEPGNVARFQTVLQIASRMAATPTVTSGLAEPVYGATQEES